ncbi:MAG TPA: C25 family cysteine peptidase, partial [Candidatus Thermoplasmatota archaeon]|nr:C25 family cysteine peptidase [Candidatus Thermoplasmatota archaeon]
MDGEFLILKKDSLVRYGFGIVLSFILLSLVFFSFFVSADPLSSYSQTFTFSFHQPTFSTVRNLNKTYTKIFLEECTPLGKIGYPELPSKTINILVPFKHEIKDIICVNRQENDYSLQVKHHDVIPLQSESSFSNDHTLHCFEKNETIYKKNMVHPTESFKKRSIHYASGFPIVSLTLNPFQYNPSGKKLMFSSELSLKIIFQPTQQEPINPYFRGQQSDSQPLKEMVINPEAVNTYPLTDNETMDQTVLTDGEHSDEAVLGSSYPGGLCASAEYYDYVIVTSELLTDQSDYSYNWTNLLIHRQQQDGFTGRIVTIEDIITCSDYGNTSSIFDDDAARLREFCKDAYLDWNTAYILLGGDWDINTAEHQIVPCRIMTDLDENSSGYNTMASDLYFSNLDGDWYYDSEGVWGGGSGAANDKYSELSVGRIPVSTPAHVSNIVQKIIWYDTCQDDEWLSSAAFLGGYLGDWASTSKDYMEELRNGDGSFSEYTGFEEWNAAFPSYEIDTSHRYYDADYDTESDAVNAWKQAINTNQFSLISHLDHGSRYNTLSLGSGSDLSNSHFFLGTSQACL